MNHAQTDRRGSWTISSTANPSIPTNGNPFVAIEVLTSSSLTVTVQGDFGSGTVRNLRSRIISSTATESSLDPGTTSGTLAAQDVILVPTCGAQYIQITRQAGSGTLASTSYATDALNAYLTALLIDGGITATSNTEYADDGAGFTLGTSKVNAIGAIADETSPDSVNEGDIGIPRMTLDRLLKVQSVGQMREVDVTLSLDTNQYADNDLLFDTQIVTGCCRAADVPTWCVGFRVLDEDDQTAFDMDLLFLSTSTSLGTENDAIGVSDANARNILGIVQVTQAGTPSSDLANNTALYIGPNHKDMPVFIVPASGTANCYIAGVLRSGTPTFTASGIRIRMYFKD